MVNALVRTGPTIDERVAAARIPGDLSIFSMAVHNRAIEPYQLAWEQALNYEKRVCIVCPPDTYKSTTIQDWIERKIAENRNIRILWLMNAGEQSEKRVMTIGNTLEGNVVYRRAFPDIIPNKDAQWTKSVLYVQRDIESEDPTLMGCGLNGPYQGLHFDIVICDDLTNQEDVRSPTTMELQEAKIRGVVVDRLVGDDPQWFNICTRWGERDLVPVFESMGFAIIVMPVISEKYPWGNTISNKRFSPSRIDEIRRDKGDALFQLTYMCNPSAMAGNIINREHIRYWTNDTIPTHALSIFVGVDPAISVKTMADYSAIATVGMDVATRKMYLLDMFCERLDAPGLEKEVVRRATKMAGLRAVGVETIAYQLSIVQYLKRNRRLPLVELPYRTRRQATQKVIGIDRDKVARASYLDSLFISGRLYIPKDLPVVNGISLETELVTVPGGAHDDRMDALTFACALADATYTSNPKVRLRAW